MAVTVPLFWLIIAGLAFVGLVVLSLVTLLATPRRLAQAPKGPRPAATTEPLHFDRAGLGEKGACGALLVPGARWTLGVGVFDAAATAGDACAECGIALAPKPRAPPAATVRDSLEPVAGGPC